MNVRQPQHIALQSFDLFNRIEQIHHQPTAALKNLRAKYILLRKVLEQACYELTTDVTASFSNLFSRLDFVCKEKKMTPSDRYAIQTMRRNCNAALDDDFQPNMDEYLYDLRAIVRFISLGFGEDIPASLLPEIPHSNRSYLGGKLSHIPYVRVCVTSWTDTLIYAATDNSEDPFVVINYAKGGYNGDLLYLYDLLSENLQLNMLDVRVDEENHYIPRLIIVHPDYLLDISSLAACFREYGHHPYNYFINKIKPRANTAPILLGNLAGQFLDDYVNERASEPVTYAHTLNKFFTSSALEFCTCNDLSNFHALAQTQMMNIRSFINDILPHSIPNFDKRKTLLEASFICEKLGLQGRTDMMQKDFGVLIEQKSGKKDEYHNKHKEDHFIQMMLYQGILMYNFGQETQDMQTFLLYSKYTDGLIIEHFSERLFRECIQLRNRIVVNEMAFGEGAIEHVTEDINTELLNEKNETKTLWTRYQEPELSRIIQTLKHTTPIERAYFQRFYTFVSKESILSRTGGSNDPSRGFAGLWHIPLADKLEAGNILIGLKITAKEKSAPGKGYDLITLSIPQQGEDFIPNFRKGDIIIFYSYKDQPNVCKEILMKGNIVEIEPERIQLLLRNGQQNKDIIGEEDEKFAIEHDSTDSAATSSIRGLFSFLSACHDRKDLLLGLRTPVIHPERTLNGDYGRFNELILKEKQADDYFLLVGPPGTGKTSCALRHMVEEALSDPKSSLLLLSYTNRAVDEICGMLVDSGIAEHTPFIRIGNELSCDPRYVPYLMKNSFGDSPTMKGIQEKIVNTRIIVGTTTAINNRLYLFNLKRFDLAIIDEASQILEPDLIGILSARSNTQNAIDKFILIGDYKQLPAIALQSAEEAVVKDPLLQSIGLDDCRNSLFERLYKQSEDSFRSVLRKQGRMHPAISEFPNNAFYHREQLEPVPLKHQEEAFPYPISNSLDEVVKEEEESKSKNEETRISSEEIESGNLETVNCNKAVDNRSGKTENRSQEIKDSNSQSNQIDKLLQNRRMIFIPAETPALTEAYSEKTNINEARIVATLLQHVYRLTKDHFNPDKTVGVIVPYRNQIAMIKKEIFKLGIPALEKISVDTVERYQGSQRDVIIYSFTIRNVGQLNFLTANTFTEGTFQIDRKLNVAITRARKQLIMTGNPEVLGANITFFKLMEYIRMNNGYLSATVDDFCNGRFEIPAYHKTWDLKSQSFSLPDDFLQSFHQFIEEPLLQFQGTSTDKEGNLLILGNTEARNRELIAYGRTDFLLADVKTPNKDDKDTLTPMTYAQLYAFYQMRKQYAAARSLFEQSGTWLRDAIANTSGRIVFCDLSYEAGASGLAFVDACRKYPRTDITYLGIYPMEEVGLLTEKFFQAPSYQATKTLFNPRLAQVSPSFWNTHAKLSELIVFNLSNVFDRISLREAYDLAQQINHLVHVRPLNHYILFFRDDAGERKNLHTYTAFCNQLSDIIRPLNEQMPFMGEYFLQKGIAEIPNSEQYLYEIRSTK